MLPCDEVGSGFPHMASFISAILSNLGYAGGFAQVPLSTTAALGRTDTLNSVQVSAIYTLIDIIHESNRKP